MTIKKCSPTTDIFHKKCRELTEDEKSLILQIKEEADQLYSSMNYHYVNFTHGETEMKVALTSLATAVMWATKAITSKN